MQQLQAINNNLSHREANHMMTIDKLNKTLSQEEQKHNETYSNLNQRIENLKTEKHNLNDKNLNYIESNSKEKKDLMAELVKREDKIQKLVTARIKMTAEQKDLESENHELKNQLKDKEAGFVPVEKPTKSRRVSAPQALQTSASLFAKNPKNGGLSPTDPKPGMTTIIPDNRLSVLQKKYDNLMKNINELSITNSRLEAEKKSQQELIDELLLAGNENQFQWENRP